MTKKEIIDLINATKRGNLNNSNTSYSKINTSKEVWWFNVLVSKFSEELHLLLNANGKVIWLHLPKGFVSNLNANFKIRQDKNAVDLEISADKSFKYLQDIKSGGTGFDFRGFVKDTISF